MRNRSKAQEAAESANGRRGTLQLTATDRLLVLLVMKLGASQAEIAAALGVSQPTISRVLGGLRVKRTAARGPMGDDA